MADILPPRRGFECLRPARAGRLWPTATAVGKRQLLTLQPASAGDRNLTSNPQFFLSPLPGLHPLSASFSHGLRYGPHSVAATRLAAVSLLSPRLPPRRPEPQKERSFPHPSRKKKLLKSKRESTLLKFAGAFRLRKIPATRLREQAGPRKYIGPAPSVKRPEREESIMLDSGWTPARKLGRMVLRYQVPGECFLFCPL